jgi:hypothetical protein
MVCPQCERLQQQLLKANLEYINADSDMQHFSRRSKISDYDGHTYRLLIDRLHQSRGAYEELHREMVEHELEHRNEPTSVIAATGNI